MLEQDELGDGSKEVCGELTECGREWAVWEYETEDKVEALYVNKEGAWYKNENQRYAG